MEKRNLSTLSPGETGVVLGTYDGRLKDLGVVAGTKILCLQRSPLKDPTAYAIRGAVFAIRKEDAERICLASGPEVEIWD